LRRGRSAKARSPEKRGFHLPQAGENAPEFLIDELKHISR
jgi:hypothetical protein